MPRRGYITTRGRGESSRGHDYSSRSRGRGYGSTSRGRGYGSTSRGRGVGRGNYSRSRSRASYHRENQGEVANILSKIMERLDRLEQGQGPSRAAGPPTPTRQPGSRDGYGVSGPLGSTSDQPTHSENPDFRGLVSNTFKYVQSTHHAENWQEILDSISRGVDRLVENLRPPQPTETLRADLRASATSFKNNIRSLVNKHLLNTAHAAKNNIQQMNQTDIKLVQKIAAAQYKRKLGTRARQDTLETALEKMEGWIKPKKTNNRTLIKNNTTTTNTQNRFGALAEVEPEADPENISDDALLHAAENIQTTGLRRKPSSPPGTSPAHKTQRPDNTRMEEEESVVVPPSPNPNRVRLTSARAPPQTVSDNWQGGELVVGDPGSRNAWRLGPCDNGITTVVIADSNGVCWKDARMPLPPTWRIFAFRGATLQDVAALLQAATDDLRPVTRIVIAVGVNDRKSETSNTMTSLHAIQQWAERRSRSVYFVGIPPHPIVNMAERSTLARINAQAQDIFAANFIQPIPEEEFYAPVEDSTGVHYSCHTAERIIDSILQHLNLW